MRIYRLLLYLYPASFRADYGDEMEAIFRTHLRNARGARRLTLWFGIFHEVIMNLHKISMLSSRRSSKLSWNYPDLSRDDPDLS